MTRRGLPRYKRLLILVLGALTFLSVPQSVEASSFHYSASFDGYIDDQCGTGAETFRVTAYRDANFSGPRVRLCSPQANLCSVPLFATTGCPPWGVGSLNDKLTSYTVQWRPAGRCIAWYRDSGYDGLLLISLGDVSNVGADDNDEASSLRLAC